MTSGFDPDKVKRPLSFNSNERLKSRLEIQKVMKQGRRIRQGPVSVFFLSKSYKEQEPVVQAAFSVPKRRFKSASDRNRIKRRLREAYRLAKFDLIKSTFERKKSLSLLIVWSDNSILSYINLKNELDAVIQRLQEEL